MDVQWLGDRIVTWVRGTNLPIRIWDVKTIPLLWRNPKALKKSESEFGSDYNEYYELENTNWCIEPLQCLVQFEVNTLRT